jgi:phenylalanyl-tRNA synthetase alpha chain
MDAERLQTEALAAILGAQTLAELDEVRVRFLGRSSELKLALREVRDRETGQRLNGVREHLEAAVAERQAILERADLDHALTTESVDVTLPGTPAPRGHLHLITQIRRQVEDVFLGLGYEIFDGPEIDDRWHNFTALNTPDWHPSTSPNDTFYLAGDDNLLLRTHTSPGQIRFMETHEPPVYMVSLGRCYRRDTPDPTHTPFFHQVEALAVDRGITLADLKGTIQYLARELYGPEREIRIRTSYFPFTEPSIEADVSCFLCGGVGCRVCGDSGWIEMGGAGVVDPNVFQHVGYDPEEVSGFAFGFGLERMAMLRHGLPDIRALWENDLRLLRQF